MRALLTRVVGDGSDPAQKAVANAVLNASNLSADTPVAAAARRFAALPTNLRNAWLVAHAADLHAGRITLDQIP